MKARAPGTKLVLFMIVTALTTALLATVVGNMRFGASTTYRAIFTDVSGLVPGEDVKVAGVPIGKVETVQLQESKTGVVSFSLDDKVKLTESNRLAVKYKNLIGDRYLEISQESTGGLAIPAGTTIPIERTQSALDLDDLVNGFRPLLQGLDPEQTNQFSASLIQVLNGQSNVIGTLVAQIGSLTNTLADRDQTIGRVIDNLDTVLATVDNRSQQFSSMLDQLQLLIGGLATDKESIANALENIDAVTGTLMEILKESRPSLQQDISQLGALSSNLNASSDTLNLVLAKLPEAYKLLGRGTYGSFFNFYLCGVAVKLSDQSTSPMFTSPTQRCQ